jgi:hypothetical protein
MQKLAHAPARYNSRHAFFLSLQIFSGGARTSTPHNPAALTVRPEKGQRGVRDTQPSPSRRMSYPLTSAHR